MDRPTHGEDAKLVTTDLVEPPTAATPSVSIPRERSSRVRLTGLGTFLVISIPLFAVGAVGLTQQATLLPSSLGLTLIVATTVAALLAKTRASWVAVVSPPLALALAVAVLGQITLLGSSLSITREVAMFSTAMTAYAPAQVLSVGMAGLIMFLRARRRRSRKGDPAGSLS